LPIRLTQEDRLAIGVQSRAGKYVTFQLSRQYFAIRSDRVRQIVPAKAIRPASGGIPYVRGSVGANGRLIPVVDVRDRVAAMVQPVRAGASVLIVSLDGDCPIGMVGLIVDRLSEVVDLRETDIHGNLAQQHLHGRPYGRPRVLLEPETLLTREDWNLVGASLY
jgi:purine-binding chemotaxis protein CheW